VEDEVEDGGENFHARGERTGDSSPSQLSAL
jgi:hypothetical protein